MMRITYLVWRAAAMSLAVSFASAVSAAPETTSNATNTYTNATLGIQFQYPARFVVGRYHPEPEFEKAIVLAEPKVLGSINPHDIPVGEVPAISLSLQEGEDAEFTITELCRAEFKTKIGNFSVYKLPGFPGPYGDQAFCYYVMLPRKKVMEAVAHRYYFDDTTDTNRFNTHYDLVIEDIIKSLRVVKK